MKSTRYMFIIATMMLAIFNATASSAAEKNSSIAHRPAKSSTPAANPEMVALHRLNDPSIMSCYLCRIDAAPRHAPKVEARREPVDYKGKVDAQSRL